MKYLVAIAALIGCDNVFNLEEVVDGAAVDSGIIGERPEFCATAELFEPFDGSTPCAFGAPFEEGSLAQRDGVLEISVTGAGFVYAGCSAYRPYPFSDRGVFLRVTQPMTVANGVTRLKVRNTFETTPELDTIIEIDGALRFLVNNAVVAERDDFFEWWRIRQLEGTSLVAAELSHDGITWEPWAMAAAALPPSIAVDIAAGLTGPSTPGKAEFSAFGICM